MSVLENQVALITSATSSIGKVYAKHLLQNGVKVALCDIDFEACQLFANELSNVFGDNNVLALGYFIAENLQLESAFNSCLNHFGRMDIVVNNMTEMKFHVLINNQDENNFICKHYSGVISGTLLAIKYMGAPYGGNGGTVVQTTNCRSATNAVVGYTKLIGDEQSSHYLKIRTMALDPRNDSDNVGRALIYILKQGITGQYWIVENEETPRLAVTTDIIN
ncbi:15-hydroxyprostaglandin dehydrogenase [NAD(+)]-like [Rhopalosiphum maidis]|uniref:15-hydroxyprostaglandin dehydrogenase [NAD(+)]-like n=1 Tax=Rhopalosiphum maidis TaxID=43146 RepID=UPI000EFDFCCF|nr:15-hydroxyprostaglandin dehydrogenase [NAD(+)]-like [Rhopalosiphum maidis]